MTRKKKAYKCTFPTLVDGYDDNMWSDPTQYEIIYGSSQKDAIKERCEADETYTFWELKKAINTRRYADGDLYEQDKSDTLNNLTEKQINHLTHSLGVTECEVYPEKTYRNYSMYYDKNEECEKLIKLGLMENWEKMGSQVYAVTDIGIEAIKTLFLTTNIKEPID